MVLETIIHRSLIEIGNKNGLEGQKDTYAGDNDFLVNRLSWKKRIFNNTQAYVLKRWQKLKKCNQLK